MLVRRAGGCDEAVANRGVKERDLASREVRGHRVQGVEKAVIYGRGGGGLEDVALEVWKVHSCAWRRRAVGESVRAYRASHAWRTFKIGEKLRDVFARA